MINGQNPSEVSIEQLNVSVHSYLNLAEEFERMDAAMAILLFELDVLSQIESKVF